MQTQRLQRFGLISIPALAIFAALTAANPDRPKTDEPAKNPPIKRLATIGDFSEWVTSLAYAPDGHTLAIGSYDIVRLWNTESKKVDATLDVKTGYVKGIAFSPDGKLLATAGYQSLDVWEIATRTRKFKSEGHAGYVTAVAFSPDGKWFVTSSEDESVRVWNAADGSEVRSLKGHSYPVNGVAFSPDGKQIASAAGDATRVTRRGEVKLWDAATGSAIAKFEHHAKSATSVAFSPDGKLLASTSVDEKVIVYDVASAKPIGEYDAHSRPTNCVLFTPDSRTIISGCGGRAKGGDEVRIWDWKTGQERGAIALHKGPVAAVALSPDGRTLATGSYDKSAAIWDLTAALSDGKTPETIAKVDSPAESKEKPPTSVEPSAEVSKKKSSSPIRIGIIGLDTSHAIAFTKEFNAPKPAADLAGFRVVAAYPKGSPDIESSVSRVPMYIKDVQGMGVEIVDSIDALLEKVDVVLLETNDGRPHLEQALAVMKKGKRVFIDKPVAGSLTDAVAIYEAAKKYNVPVFSSSSLRYGKNSQAARAGKIGRITSAETFSPCTLEKTHPDLFWYGIHGVESLFTVMGTGCVSVQRTVSNEKEDVVVGTWEDGRTGTFRGSRDEKKGGYGGTAEGTDGKMDVGDYGGYTPLVVEIAKFFRTGTPPVSAEETLQIYAFMEAADESKRQNGATVTLESVLKKAHEQAAAKLSLNDNTLTPEEQSAGWQLLFNGKDLTGWRCNNGKPIASKIEEDSLVPHKSGGYIIIHEKPFGNFTLKCDVKMDSECNSGIFFRVGNPEDPVQTGFEVQVSSDKDAGYHDFGAIYDLVKPSKNNARGKGEWNSVEVTCKGPEITVVVNGETVSRINCDEWTDAGKGPDGRKNKFTTAVKDFPRKGYLGFQDHGHKVWFKNVKLLEH
ncbi:MAG: family 16 glycoside hydrolase [Planctomycetaceae bacterium]